jgi:predicted ester cyclase
LIDNEYAGAGTAKGPEAYLKEVRLGLEAFPNLQFTLEDVFVEGNKVAARWQWIGTHQSTFKGMIATHKWIINKAIVIFDFKGNKIIRSCSQLDRLAVLQ